MEHVSGEVNGSECRNIFIPPDFVPMSISTWHISQGEVAS